MADYVFILTINTPEGEQGQITFQDFPARLGSSEDNTVYIPHDSVSAIHAVLNTNAEGFLTITDMASDTGVFVEGEQVDESVLPTSGEFKLGDVSCQLTISDGDVEPEPEAASEPEPVSEPAGDELPNLRRLGGESRRDRNKAAAAPPPPTDDVPELRSESDASPAAVPPPKRTSSAAAGGKASLVTRYFYQDLDETTCGPFRRREIEQAIARNEVLPESPVKVDDDGDWYPASDFPEFSQALSKAPKVDAQELKKQQEKERKAAESGKPAKVKHDEVGAHTISIRGYDVGYAGFWRRLAAYFIDGILVNIISFIIFVLVMMVFAFQMVMSVVTGDSINPEQLQQKYGWLMSLALNGALLITAFLYFVKAEAGHAQATFGKRIMGIMVTNTAGEQIGLMQSFWRHLAKIFSVLTLGIGFLMAMIPPRKRALHDIMSGCVVVENPRGANTGCVILTLVLMVVLGGAGVVGLGVILPSFTTARMKASQVNDSGSLKQVSISILMYSGDRNGALPPDLATLVEEGYVKPGPVFVSRYSETTPPTSAAAIRGGQCDWVYNPLGLTMDDQGNDLLLAHSKRGIYPDGTILVLYLDGHVEKHSAEEVEALLSQRP